jgi:hypothetical protein
MSRRDSSTYLVVFDLARVRDRSTFAESTLTAEGIAHVMVSGRFVIENGKPTAERPGRVLRPPGRSPRRKPVKESRTSDTPEQTSWTTHGFTATAEAHDPNRSLGDPERGTSRASRPR